MTTPASTTANRAFARVFFPRRRSPRARASRCDPAAPPPPSHHRASCRDGTRARRERRRATRATTDDRARVPSFVHTNERRTRAKTRARRAKDRRDSMTIDLDGSIALDDDDDESAETDDATNARAFCFSSFAQTAGGSAIDATGRVRTKRRARAGRRRGPRRTRAPCLLYTSPSPRDRSLSRMPSSA